MTETNKPLNPLKAILFKSHWSISFSFIITALLVLLSFVNIILFAFFGMQINSIVFLVFSLISFVFVLIASFETASAGRTTVNWIMFIITAAAVVIAALTTNFFKSVPKVELDNISNTLIALTFGCYAIIALCNGNIAKKDAREVSKEASEETALETSEEIEEVSEESNEELDTNGEASEEKI
ncbi:hypothetical protein [Candidatus Clostridium radicumherbarum]|uniref:MARVEL domain-containing protein n=1 Tax=Candidatus Clostridium radicumherbarum TaxID=3381662 RepID=A0ABW8TVC8_9CLOT